MSDTNHDLKITEFYDMDTHSFTYVVHDGKSRDAIVIDPVLGGTHKEFIQASELNLRGILETHVHADHLTGSQELKDLNPGAPICVGERICKVGAKASAFDILFKDFEQRTFGTIQVKTRPTPGHTPCSLSYLIGNNVFTGDALFMPDFGTGRCDFTGGSARELFKSITQNLYSLPDSTNVFVCHDYCPGGRELAFQTTIGESKVKNIHVNAKTTEEEFVEMREARDKTLEPPKNLERNIKFNINAGISG